MRQTCKEEEEGGHSRQRELQRHGRAWNVPETERRLDRGWMLVSKWERGGRKASGAGSCRPVDEVRI